MLTTLLRPTSGKIELDGLDPTVHKNEARRQFGIVFQDPSLDSEQTAYENMELHGVLYHVPRKVRAERIEDLLKLFELWERRDDYVKTFSGGMKRRLEIARGFLHTPKILFLDEPTLGLDPQSRNQLWTHVKHLNETQKTTVFLTTHYMDEADRVAHRIAIIDHGRHRRPGHAAGTEGADQHRIAGAGVPRADRLLDSRRERDLGRPDAPSRQDVEATPMSAIYILWLRELKRYVRSRAQIIASLGQPLLYLLALGFGLGPVFQKAGNGSYLQFMAPGVIGMTILFTSIFSGIAMLWDRQFGFLKETLVAPVPRIQIMIGRTLGGATVAVIQGTLILIVCLIAGFRPAQLSRSSPGISFHGADRHGLRGARHGVRLDHPGHAGLSADHELHGAADLLSLGSAVSADQSAQAAGHHHPARSAHLWRGRAARRAHQRFALRPGARCFAARRHCRRFPVAGRIFVFAEFSCRYATRFADMARTRSTKAHEKVLEAALALFGERGIDAASMDAIAEKSASAKPPSTSTGRTKTRWPSKLCR